MIVDSLGFFPITPSLIEIHCVLVRLTRSVKPEAYRPRGRLRLDSLG